MSWVIRLLCIFLTAPLALLLAADGRAAYDRECKRCHGANGEGNPKIASMLKVAIRHLGSAEVQKKSDAELKKIIVAGAGKMKPVTKLSAQETADVVALLRTMKE